MKTQLLEMVNIIIRDSGFDIAVEVVSDIFRNTPVRYELKEIEKTLKLYVEYGKFSISDTSDVLYSLLRGKEYFSKTYKVGYTFKSVLTKLGEAPTKMSDILGAIVVADTDGKVLHMGTEMLKFVIKSAELDKIGPFRVDAEGKLAYKSYDGIEVIGIMEPKYHEDGYTPYMILKPGVSKDSKNPKDYTQAVECKKGFKHLLPETKKEKLADEAFSFLVLVGE